MVARDFNADFGGVAKSYLQRLDSLSTAEIGAHDKSGLQLREITVLLLKAIYQLVQPEEVMANLYVVITLISRRFIQYFGLPGSPTGFKKELDQVAICLYILESTVCLQCGLPSICMFNLQRPDALSAPEVVLRNQIHQIASLTTTYSGPEWQNFVRSLNLPIAPAPVNRYDTLKLITLFRLSMEEASRSLASPSHLSQNSELLDLVAFAAHMYIENVVEREERNTLCSIQLSAEGVLQAGAILGAHLVILARRPHLTETSWTKISRADILLGFVQVSSLLSSFKHRWEPCAAYVKLWDTFAEFVLAISI
ncbi:hypothetical protein A1O1_04549 [Capronia coronata CBS 617.96]|uniref:Transcription factor domain-containing protein n=1 Tax=Capronia coronata CBS 617.96 TaxID=1182541 RepID=W9YEZ2_9EURO|nr:uncharacterized protein A1O1_04549 [Capronia coronata CBS 617.96]EXJ91437.1 hypothetical protein A1O1_04549 [Capronia coronata CBS 617.96]